MALSLDSYGTVAFLAGDTIAQGQPFGIIGTGFTAGLTATWNGQALTVLSVETRFGRAVGTAMLRAPMTDGIAPVILMLGSETATGPMLKVGTGVNPPPTPPPTPPPSNAPILDRIEPASGPQGSTVAFIGQNLGTAKGSVIWTVTGNLLYRFTPATWSDTRVTMAVPVQGAFPGAISGPVFLRRADGQRTDTLTFTVGTAPAPPPPNPPPNPPPTPPPSDDLAMCRDVIARVNVERQKAGLMPFSFASEVGTVSDAVTVWEIGRVSWTNAEGKPSARGGDIIAAMAAVGENPACMKAAQDYAADMVANGYFSHTGKDGSSPGDRMVRAGWSGTTWGENIANGFSTSEAVMLGWMNSSGHRANILNPAFTLIGVGKVSQMWVMDLGNGGSAPPPNPPPPNPPPAPTPTPGGLAVMGYSAASVKAGERFTVQGQGFTQTALVELDGLDLRLASVTGTAIQCYAPDELMTAAVVVRQGNDEASGPALEVQG